MIRDVEVAIIFPNGFPTISGASDSESKSFAFPKTNPSSSSFDKVIFSCGEPSVGNDIAFSFKNWSVMRNKLIAIPYFVAATNALNSDKASIG